MDFANCHAKSPGEIGIVQFQRCQSNFQHNEEPAGYRVHPFRLTHASKPILYLLSMSTWHGELTLSRARKKTTSIRNWHLSPYSGNVEKLLSLLSKGTWVEDIRYLGKLNALAEWGQCGKTAGKRSIGRR